MRWDEAVVAVRDARSTVEEGDNVVKALADLLVGRLRVSGVRGTTLAQLKRELREFNITTRDWS